MSNVQPITPYEPTTSVLLAIKNSPLKPEFPTTPSLAATTPIQQISNYNAIKQLPSYTVTSLLSQQAVINNNLSNGQKIQKGIVDGPAGATLSQLSLPGQPIKPGAGIFINSLQQTVPNLPFNVAASNALMTGSGGVKSPLKLVSNTSAQTSAITNSIQTATIQLTNSNILTGKETPTQVAGVIMAGATLGTSTVIEALKDPTTVASKIGGGLNEIGNAITSGNFAANMADKLSSGLGGLTNSINGVVSGAVGALSSGINNFINKAPGNLSALVSSASGALQNAFNLAEKSFGDLKAGVENVLGGAKTSMEPAASKLLALARENSRISDELSAAFKDLSSARKAYFLNSNEETLTEVRRLEEKVSGLEQKLAKASNEILTTANVGTPTAGLFGGLSTQNLSTLANSAVSGLLNSPNSSNTGINSLPGGLGAFASQISSAASNVIGSIKNAATTITSNLPGAANALSNPTQLAGNLISNVQQSVSGIAGNLSQGISNLTGSLSATLANAQNTVNNLTSNIALNGSSIVSNITSSLGGLGNAPGQIKTAILGSDTFKETKAAVNSVIGKILDPKIPAPIFEDVVAVAEPDIYQQEQVTAQLALEELYAKREAKTYELGQIVEQFDQNQQPELITEIDLLKNDIATIDIEIVAAQNAYDNLFISNGSAQTTIEDQSYTRGG